MKTLFFSLGLLLAASSYAQKEQPLPKDLPPFGPEKPLQAPEVKQTKVENGMTIWLVRRPGFPKVTFTLTVVGGYAADPADRPGFSQLLTATIDQGTKKRTARQIAEDMQGAGGDVNAFAVRDAIRISASVLSSKITEGLAVLADLAEDATFPDGEVTLARRNLTDQLEQQETDPSFQANRAIAKVLFGNGPYGVFSPTKDSLAAATPAELRSEFARRFRPDQAALLVVGDFNSDQMLSLARDNLAGWHSPSSPPVAPAIAPSVTPPHAIFLVPRPESVQTTLAFGAPGPHRGDPDFEAAEVANAIYGGTFGSRLITNIREDKGYTYAPGAFLQSFRAAGVLRTEADVRNAVTGASLNEILYEMNRMVTTSPTDTELQQAKHNLVGIEAITLQSREAVAGELADLWTRGLPPEEIVSYGKKITAITADDVNAAAKKYFPASRVSIIAVGEEKVIREALAPFGLPINPAP
jgi:predicted Zn-dependent peptidase